MWARSKNRPGQRKKKKARGRLLFADLFITDPTCSIELGVIERR
jgi:hypothetical protein